jgi:hypothetical protein
LLQLAVQCQMNRITGNIGNFMKHAHTPAQSIDFDLLPAALASENFFPAAFQTVLSISSPETYPWSLEALVVWSRSPI